MNKITGVDLVKFAQKVYELSRPQGAGFMHFTLEPLSEEDAKSMMIKNPFPGDGQCIMTMDYVKGRACKMQVFKTGEDLFIGDSWYDHTDNQLAELLEAFNIIPPQFGEHGCACNCVVCRNKRGE